MALEVTMPQMGESVVEGTVTKWLVKEGDRVREDQPLCEISTDKVDTEIPSPGSGVITQIVAGEGQTLPVGALIAVIDSAAAATGTKPAAPAAPVQAEPRPSAAAAEPPALRAVRRPPSPVSPSPAPAETGATPSASAAPMPSSNPAPAQGAVTRPPTTSTGDAPRRYSPVVLRMAEEHGIDLSHIPGSGLGGRISKRDVERYLESLRSGSQTAHQQNGAATSPEVAGAAKPVPNLTTGQPSIAPATGNIFRPPVYQPHEGDTVEPFTRRRKLIAEHMVFSKTHSPHVGTVAEVDLTRVMTLRDAHKAAFAKSEGFALTLLPFAAMATVRGLQEFPRMNSSVVGDSVVIRHEINLGIAMDAEEGLVVPVIKAAESMSLIGLAREIERLRKKVAERSLSVDDLAGGSFTLSNPGREGNLYGFAIINQPQVVILRMGEVKKRPVVVEINGSDALAIRTMMFLALSYDHRVIDGVLGNRFLYRTGKILEEAGFEL
ncbi:MAG TPA: dihydrolipoamide acetyltransferase family protein [Candidatus Binataceae bacterium]|nr:dihydrolipoamide acetyltransferase family protein [Candidatus Binataceae bacterium]